MKIKILALSLMLAFLTSGNAGVVSAKQSRVIEFVKKDGSKIATIHVNAQSLLFEFNDGSDAVLFSDEAFFTMNNKDKTYRVQTYAELQASASRKAVEIAQSPKDADAAQGGDLKLTEETDTISGLRVRKLIQTNKGETEAEFWVSSELLPQSVRAFGEKMRSIFPKDYWTSGRARGLVEIVTLFGVPLRMTYGHDTYQARIVESSSSDSSFQVPAGYRKLDK
ncbi:MAG: hypothetical protein AABN34_17715 [Acidobacteriota bacterium]